MPDLRVVLVNCPIHGELWSNHGRENPEARSRNHIQLALSGYTVDLFQLPAIVRGPIAEFRDRLTVTSEVYFRNVPPHELARARQAARDLAWLLSLACLSEVQAIQFDYGGRSETVTPFGVTRFFRPIIDPFDGAAVHGFVEQAWPQFRFLKRRRQLHEVIHYLLIAERPEQPIEVKLALVFIVLENLKATFARSVGIPYARGGFRKIGTPPKPNLASEPRYKFHELLEMMQQSVGMNRPIRRIIRLRNRIVHFGITPLNVERRAFYYEACVALIVEYLLRLMAYRGSYNDYQTLTNCVL